MKRHLHDRAVTLCTPCGPKVFYPPKAKMNPIGAPGGSALPYTIAGLGISVVGIAIIAAGFRDTFMTHFLDQPGSSHWDADEKKKQAGERLEMIGAGLLALGAGVGVGGQIVSK